MLGIYFSGTGNTKHCVETFIRHIDSEAIITPIESTKTVDLLKNEELIIFGYPIYFSNIPKIVRDFLITNGSYFRDKKIFIIATMGLFSGDGAGCSARLLKKYGAEIVGGLHLKMPDCIGDEKLLKKTLLENQKIIEQADAKIAISADKFKQEKPTQEGLSIFHHIAGLFGQRLWFYKKTQTYKKLPNINTDKCIGCRMCAELCPMKNIIIADGKAVSGDKCTMCYRCFGHCPTASLTILGQEVHEQCLFENYQKSSLVIKNKKSNEK